VLVRVGGDETTRQGSLSPSARSAPRWFGNVEKEHNEITHVRSIGIRWRFDRGMQ
jgi:hypothetical protein